MASVLILSFSTVASDPRVTRQVGALAAAHEVVTCGYGPAPAPAVRHIEIAPSPRSRAARALALLPLQLGLHERHYWAQPQVRGAELALRDARFDLLIANDLGTLPLALRVAAGKPVLFDAHEYSPREFEDRLLWRLLLQRHYTYLCETRLPGVAAMTTVCQGIADEYRRSFGVNAAVITNATRFHDLAPRASREGVIRMIHHGAAMASRRLEVMIEVMERLDARFSLDFVLVPGDPAYIRALERRASGHPRIRFLTPVPMEDLVALSSGYDVGLFLLPPANFNYLAALPNKFFEFIQARLALAIGPSPEMARIVNEFGCGVVAQDFSPTALAHKLNALGAVDIDRMKAGSSAAALAYHAGSGAEKLRALVAEVLARGDR